MTIQKNLLKQVSNERLMNYLMDKGWAELPIERSTSISLISPSGYEVLIPAVEHLVDYDCMMEIAISIVSAVDNVECNEVLEDILSPPVIKLTEIQDITSRLEPLVDKYDGGVVLKDVLELLKDRERMLEVVAPVRDSMNNTQVD